MNFSILTVYCFSGTGNSRRGALWLTELARKRNMPADVVPIDRIRPPKEAPPDGALLGFVFPIHGFITIWVMLKFILRFPATRRRIPVFTVAGLGGTKFGRTFLPGWEGCGLYLPLFILRLKGYRPVGAERLRNMPANWTALHPGYGERNSKLMVERNRPRMERFAEIIFTGGRSYTGRISLVFGLLILPVSIGYLLFGRFYLAKIMFATSRCDGCALCARSCPVRAIRMVGHRPYWLMSCESCMRCINYCPRGAVQASHSFAALLWMLVSLPVPRWLFVWLGWSYPKGDWLNRLIDYPYYLASLAAAYLLWFLLLRIKPLNLLFEYTTFTRLYHRYREPGTRLADLRPEAE